MRNEFRAVLVGDPQQLPATILSARAKEASLERSLFERLQAGGCPVQMLSVQYRMHPGIREFPSKYFYDNQLEDGCVPCSGPCEQTILVPSLRVVHVVGGEAGWSWIIPCTKYLYLVSFSAGVLLRMFPLASIVVSKISLQNMFGCRVDKEQKRSCVEVKHVAFETWLLLYLIV